MNEGKQIMLFAKVSIAKEEGKKLFFVTAAGTITGEYDPKILSEFSSLPLEDVPLEGYVIPLKNVSIQQVGTTNVVNVNVLTVYSDQIIASSLLD